MRWRRSITQDKAADENFLRIQEYFLCFHEETIQVQGTGSVRAEAIADTTTWHDWKGGTTGALDQITGFVKRVDAVQSRFAYLLGYTSYNDFGGKSWETRVLATHANGTTYTTTCGIALSNVANQHTYWGFGVQTTLTLPVGIYSIKVQFRGVTAPLWNVSTDTNDYAWLRVAEVPMDKANNPDSENH